MPNGLIFLATGSNASFMLVEPTGRIVYRGAFGDGVDYAFRLSTAAAAPRFAFDFGHIAGGLFGWKALDKVVVFDYRTMKDVFQLKLRPETQYVAGGETWRTSLVALAPDGRRLAVLSGSVLKVFDIPR
jgi:hypothetical protein